MNTSALKTFAPSVRRQLMEAVERKLDVVLAAQLPDYRTTYAKQVETLRKLAKSDRKGLVERVAYTWFNRLAALRYLDARGWHPFRARVLMPASPEETQPELLKLMRTGALPDDLRRHTDASRLNDLLDGRIPSDNPQGEVYRHLVLAACRFYHALLPDLFERLDDETELLLPDDLLTEQSIVDGFRTEITDDDCQEVELLGWLYQFYISEKKDAVMARKKAVPSEDIPAVTQLFTPHWIVRYLVENSLGRLWLLNRPNSQLRDRMPYFIEGDREDDFLRIERPEEIRLIDPAVGSGHMLTYAFDLLYAIYEEEGYAPSEIPGLILKHNLYGVDIDPRAAQLAMLALVLKAREKSRRFFQPEQLVPPNVIALRDVKFGERELQEYIDALDLGGLFTEPVRELLGQFEHATTFGSLIQPVLGEGEIRQLRRRIEEKEVGGDLLLSGSHQKVLRVLEQAEYLTQRYHVAVANPPYMNAGSFSAQLVRFARENYPAAAADLFSLFIARNLDFIAPHGYNAMVTMQSWMFLHSYTELRDHIISTTTLVTLAQFGARAFSALSGEVVQTCAFVLASTSRPEHQPIFFRLIDGGEEFKQQALLSRERSYRDLAQREFNRIEGSPIAYWVSAAVIESFASEAIREFFDVKEGLGTRNDERFLRCFWEVASSRMRQLGSGTERWVKTDKAGGSRKWYGHNLFVLDWENDGHAIKNYRNPDGSLKSRPQNTQYFFRDAVSWGKVGTGRTAFRFRDESHAFNDAAPSLFGEHLEYAIGLLNSPVFEQLLEIQGGTMNVTVGVVAKLPFVIHQLSYDRCVKISRSCVDLARTDWDNSEVSPDFRDLPLLRPELTGATLAESWQKWKCHTDAAIRRMQELETENNRLFIEAYGLQDELSPEVPEAEITLTRADKRRDVAAFLSYAVGCMMGRYSLDKPGLILADAESTREDYLEKVGKPIDELTFAPDADGIIPILDGEWFEDDIVARTRDFLRATFGEDTLRENIRFIEESLGKDLRRYFLTNFYKDHLQTYKKRPIYWMVQSPKKGFSVLIYLHRYTKDTMNLVLNRYLREYQAKLRDRLAHLARIQANDSLSTREKTAARKESDKLTKVLHECEEWERQTVLPLAQQRIELDLDDGVKVNYAKLGEALAKVPGLN